jgi:hypothetical protein
MVIISAFIIFLLILDASSLFLLKITQFQEF